MCNGHGGMGVEVIQGDKMTEFSLSARPGIAN